MMRRHSIRTGRFGAPFTFRPARCERPAFAVGDAVTGRCASAARPLPPETPLEAILGAIPSLPRPVLARLTQRLIDRLDELAGDPDLEPEDDWCEAGDDGCGPVWRHGRLHWGSEQEGEGV